MSGKLKIPTRNSLKGLKVFCTRCKLKNPKCNHYDKHRFRMHVHVPGTSKKELTKVLDALDYKTAFDEGYEFKKQMIACDYKKQSFAPISKSYTLPSAILKYYQYLNGNHELAHLQKNVSTGYRDECIRYCRYFVKIVGQRVDIKSFDVTDTSDIDVANFYRWADNKYAGKTFNKMFNELKAFYNFLIKVEKIKMGNPFETYHTKQVELSVIKSLSKSEFNQIIEAIENGPSFKTDSKGGTKNMYWPQLKEAFKLFLLTGGRREEVLTLKWSELHVYEDGLCFFEIENLKVNRSNNTKNVNSKIVKRVIAVNKDLMELLLELGYEEKKNTSDFIIYPDRSCTVRTLMDRISKSFTHYKQVARINSDVSLKNLRKTYFTWLRVVMDKQTGLLSSHSTDEILQRHYIDPKVLSAVEKAVLKLKVFG
jgi:integrase